MTIKRFALFALVLALGVFLVAALTGTAAGWADTPTSTPTPDLEATIAAEVEAALTATAQANIPPSQVSIADSVDDDAFLGPEDAPVVIVEFSDFQCGYCGVWYRETLPLILETYPDEVKFVYRDWPIFGDDSVRAAMATECAEEQGGFWEMHNLIFDKMGEAERPSLDQPTLVGFAGELGLDTTAFDACMTEQRYLDEITNDYQDAEAFGFGGTPSFVINGTLHRIGAQPFETFDRLIQEALTAAQQAAQGPATPTPAFTLTPSPTNTLAATIQAEVEAALTATALHQPTLTPSPTPITEVPLADAVDDDAFLGPEDAPVVIIEFSDFQCGYCGVWYRETLPRILAAYPDEVKFVYRDFTIFGDDSIRAAMATECAEEQGAFWEMHNLIFDKMASPERPALDQPTLASFAGELGLDTAAFDECMTSERYLAEITHDYQDAVAFGFQGTPSFIINGTIYRIGASPFETFDQIIQEKLAALGPTAADSALTPTPDVPPTPSAANWTETSLGRLTYTANPRTNVVVLYETIPLDDFIQGSGLEPPADGAPLPLSDVLEQIKTSLEGEIAQFELATNADTLEGPMIELIDDVPVVVLHLKLDAQLLAGGDLFPGLDAVWALVDLGDGQVILIRYRLDGEPDPVIYADFRAWLEANVADLAASGAGEAE